jgi:hypothetical protein
LEKWEEASTKASIVIAIDCTMLNLFTNCNQTCEEPFWQIAQSWRDEISLLCSRLKTSGVRFGGAVISHVGEQKVQGLKDHVAVEDWIFFLFLYIFMLGGLLPL